MKPKRLPEKEFYYIYGRVPRLTVELVMRNGKGVLLSWRKISPYKNRWHLPGGTVLLKEQLHDTVKRVAQEELGLTVRVGKMLGIIEYDIQRKIPHTVGAAFEVFSVKGKLRGSFQARTFGFFKKIPKATVKEQIKFLSKHGIV